MELTAHVGHGALAFCPNEHQCKTILSAAESKLKYFIEDTVLVS